MTFAERYECPKRSDFNVADFENMKENSRLSKPFWKIDIWVNNAGITQSAAIEDNHSRSMGPGLRTLISRVCLSAHSCSSDHEEAELRQAGSYFLNGR